MRSPALRPVRPLSRKEAPAAISVATPASRPPNHAKPALNHVRKPDSTSRGWPAPGSKIWCQASASSRVFCNSCHSLAPMMPAITVRTTTLRASAPTPLRKKFRCSTAVPHTAASHRSRPKVPTWAKPRFRNGYIPLSSMPSCPLPRGKALFGSRGSTPRFGKGRPFALPCPHVRCCTT